jgi:hypothetical protein
MACWLNDAKTQVAPCAECIGNKLNILTGEVAALSHGSFMFLSFCFVSAGMSFRCPPLEWGTEICTRIILYTSILNYKCSCGEASSPEFRFEDFLLCASTRQYLCIWSRYSYGLRTGRSGFDFRQGQENVLYSTSSRPSLWPTQPTIHLEPRALSLEVKRPAREANPLTSI